jgi:hypothetical protein
MTRVYALFTNLNTGTQEPEMGRALEMITYIHLSKMHIMLSELQGKAEASARQVQLHSCFIICIPGQEYRRQISS